MKRRIFRVVSADILSVLGNCCRMRRHREQTRMLRLPIALWVVCIGLTMWRSSFRACLALHPMAFARHGVVFAQQRHQPCLVADGYAQLLSLRQLAAGSLANNEMA